MQTSALYSLDFKDFIKGLGASVGGAVIGVIEQTVKAGSLTFDLKTIGTTALSAALLYLSAKYFTPAKIVSPA